MLLFASSRLCHVTLLF